MEFTVERNLLLPYLECLNVVGKNPSKTFDRVDHLSIKAEKDRLLLSASNGYVTALQEVKDDNKLSVINEGTAVVSTSTMMKMFKSSPEDARIDISTDDKALHRKIIGKKRDLKVPLLPVEPAIELKKVSSKQSFSIPADVFVSSVAEVAPWASLEEYKDKYRQLFFEFSATETRFICGDGSRFAIVVNKDSSNESKFNNGDNKGYIIPAVQATILEGMIKNSDVKRLNITFGTSSYLFETDAGLSVLLEGVPLDYADYIPYRMQSDRLDKRIVSIEVSGSELKDIISDMESVRDSDYEKKHSCIPVRMTVNDGTLSLKAKFTNEFDFSVNGTEFKTYGETKTVFDEYDMNIFGELNKFGKSDRYEFSFTGNRDIVFCRFLDDTEVRNRLVFFAPVAETTQES